MTQDRPDPCARTGAAPFPEPDPLPAGLFRRGLLYARRKALGVRLPADLLGPVRELFRPVRPMRAAGVRKARIGATRDGSYVMLDDFDGVAACSIGIGGNVSWDLALAARGLPVLQFDHTVAGPPVAHPLFRFERIGLGAETDPAARLESLPDLLRRRPPGAGDLVLKIDVEGVEWKALDCVDAATLARFRQIVCEFHNFHELRRAAWRERAARVLARLGETHQAVHLHRNNWAPRIRIGDFEVPMLLEISFASRAVYTFEPTDESFPGPLDLPATRLFPDPPLTFLQHL